jgi:hypothetical protein
MPRPLGGCQGVLNDAAVVRFLDASNFGGRQWPRAVHMVSAQHADVLRMREFMAETLDGDRRVDISVLG